MKQPGIKAYLTIQLFDSLGKPISRPRRRVSRSFLLQFIALLLMQMQQSNYATIKDITGAGFIGRISADSFDVTTSGSLRGLIVGTDPTAVNVEDFVLTGLIANGSGVGELQYLAQTISFPVTSADPSASFTITRDFLNSSGALITVSEVGLALVGDTTAANKTFLAIRDVPTIPAQVFDGQNLRLTYTLQINI